MERISEDRFRIDYRQQAPLKILLPRIDPGAAAEVVLANSAGGIAGGDHLTVRVAVGAAAAAVVTSQAAEKAYWSHGPAADLETRVIVGPRARLAWVPQLDFVQMSARALGDRERVRPRNRGRPGAVRAVGRRRIKAQ
ncbi:MAG: urease accessory protein UreD [Caldilineaceae bacterium]|nr:urease accessory protein UreD [Caldilineaceae bacterium]